MKRKQTVWFDGVDVLLVLVGMALMGLVLLYWGMIVSISRVVFHWIGL